MLGAVAGLLFLEIFLRVLGAGEILFQEGRNWMHAGGSSLRILATGESTTADNGGGAGIESWPRQLETILKKNGIDARVFNEGRGATTSDHIVARIADQVAEDRPDIVISMMGVNDPHAIRLFPSGGLRSLRVYRLGESIYERVRASFSKSIPPEFFWNLPSTKGILEELKTKALDEVWPEIQKEAQGFDSQRRARYYAFLGYFSEPELVPVSKNFTNSFKLYELSLKEHFEVTGATERYVYMMTKLEDFSRCKDILKRYTDEIGPLSEDFLMNAMKCRAADPKDDELLNLLSKNSDDMTAEDAPARSDNTRENYLRLQKILQAKKIPLIAMQYPLRDVQALEDYFSKGPVEARPFFVGNQDNFQKALETHPEKEIFMDRFAGEFGHPTALGHRLVAIAACNGVLQVLKGQGQKNLPETCSVDSK